MKVFRLITVLTIVASLFSSCSKDKIDDEVDEKKNEAEATTELKKSSSDNNEAESIFEEIYSDVSKAGEASLKSGAELELPITVELLNSPELFPRKITIDYGDGYKNLKQVTKTGKVIAVFSGKYIEEGTEISITLENYTRNEVAVEGTKTIKNEGKNDAGNQVFSVSVKDGKFTDEDGTRTWESQREREWTEGASTLLLWLDDKYSITGTASGTNVNGKDYSMKTVTPLIYSLDCYWISSGTLEYTVSVSEKDYTATVDYGDGTCDADATVTVFGQSFPFVQY